MVFHPVSWTLLLGSHLPSLTQSPSPRALLLRQSAPHPPLRSSPVSPPAESSGPGREGSQKNHSPLGQGTPHPQFTWHPRPPEAEASWGLALDLGEGPWGLVHTGEHTLKQAETRPERERQRQRRQSQG